MAPGPRLTMKTAGRPVIFASATAMKPAPDFMSAHDRLDRAVMQRIEQGEIAFARHAIHTGDGLGFKSPDNEVGNAHCGSVAKFVV